jgi:hypothetical protein
MLHQYISAALVIEDVCWNGVRSLHFFLRKVSVVFPIIARIIHTPVGRYRRPHKGRPQCCPLMLSLLSVVGDVVFVVGVFASFNAKASSRTRGGSDNNNVKQHDDEDDDEGNNTTIGPSSRGVSF